ncbi:hypothetical protein CC86DRAFT_458155 [Ophiobolus disseminans]|uniref:Uncharacterized protein n=1 Tax=Ophiobolus disseminans TaxID=1469910 RepID=A0A6A6ZR24_9PLEO|nr:hypothetical protein CC86DRAFT_458155 [Ophiobolus disseminans]
MAQAWAQEEPSQRAIGVQTLLKRLASTLGWHARGAEWPGTRDDLHRASSQDLAKCPRSNIDEDKLQSERKKRTVGRAASAMSGHYARALWLDGWPSLSDNLGDAAAPGQASVYASHARQRQHSTRRSQVRSERCQTTATVLPSLLSSRRRNPINPVPWMGRGATTQGDSFQPAETRPAYGAICAAAVVACHAKQVETALRVTGLGAARPAGQSGPTHASSMRTVTASSSKVVSTCPLQTAGNSPRSARRSKRQTNCSHPIRPGKLGHSHSHPILRIFVLCRRRGHEPWPPRYLAPVQPLTASAGGCQSILFNIDGASRLQCQVSLECPVAQRHGVQSCTKGEIVGPSDVHSVTAVCEFAH